MTTLKTRKLLQFFLPLFLAATALAQSSSDSLTAENPKAQVKIFSLVPAENFHKERIRLSAGAGAAIYAGVSVALWNAWYKDYPLAGFHTFNDWGEWEGMDKAGHLFSAYMECNYAFQGARWTGMSRRSALWTAVGIGTGIQATIEVMDGFSEKWGFSLADIGFNTLGVSLFAFQELCWQEQRIIIKVSSWRPDYSTQPIYSTDGGQVTTPDERAEELYGVLPYQVLLKDYNAMTIWSSVNIRSFLKNSDKSVFPRWLNIAVGYGAGNIYGGFENKWGTDDGQIFTLDPMNFPRYRQFYLSPDIDWTRVPTRHRWVKFTLGLLNWLKFPAPALEVNTLGKLKFHPMQW